MRASTQPILLRRISAVTAAENVPAKADFISLTRSQWDRPPAKIPNLSWYQKARVVFGVPVLGNANNTCTIQLLAATPNPDDGPFELGVSVLANGRFPEIGPFELAQYTFYPRVSAIGGTTPSVTVEVWFQAFNPED